MTMEGLVGIMTEQRLSSVKTKLEQALNDLVDPNTRSFLMIFMQSMEAMELAIELKLKLRKYGDHAAHYTLFKLQLSATINEYYWNEGIVEMVSIFC